MIEVSAGASRASAGRRAALIGCAILLAVAALAPSLGGQLVYDDLLLVARNPALHGWKGLAEHLFLPHWDFAEAQGQSGAGFWRPMAVLVQPQLDAVCGGVLFGLDPVDGDRRHLVVEAVEGTPDALVSGRASAVHCLLGPRGRLISGGSARQRRLLSRRRRWQLAALARRAAATFGGPQDVEWAVDQNERLWLLQSRPVTAVGETAMTAEGGAGVEHVGELVADGGELGAGRGGMRIGDDGGEQRLPAGERQPRATDIDGHRHGPARICGG